MFRQLVAKGSAAKAVTHTTVAPNSGHGHALRKLTRCAIKRHHLLRSRKAASRRLLQFEPVSKFYSACWANRSTFRCALRPSEGGRINWY
jgi:hypothetical protein